MTSLKPHQQRAYNAITEILLTEEKCLVSMFCGTGKTRVILNYLLDYNIVAIIVPTINLVTQLNRDYLLETNFKKLLKDREIINICSKDELTIKHNNITFSTNLDEIQLILQKKSKMKLFVCTYKSLSTLKKAFGDKLLDLIIYDESHHISSSCARQIILGKKRGSNKVNLKLKLRATKTVFFTATPINSHGVKMIRLTDENLDDELEEDLDEDLDEDVLDEDILDEDVLDEDILDEDVLDEDNLEDNLEEDYLEEDLDLEEEFDLEEELDCGKLAFKYTHREAVEDNICKDFDICIMLHTNKPDDNIYSAIGQALVLTDNTRMLTFHTYVNKTTDVANTIVVDSFIKGHTYVNNKLVKVNVKKEIMKAYKEAGKEIKDVTIGGLVSNTKNKQAILDKFDKSTDDTVNILSSCRTIGEGIDIVNANSVCIVDPKKSRVNIIQSSARCLRNPGHVKNSKKATLVLPCYVDVTKYNDKMTPDEKSKVIQESMGEHGEFRSVFNVLGAIKHDNEEYYDNYYKSISGNKNTGGIVKKKGDVKKNKVVTKNKIVKKNEFSIKVYASKEVELLWGIVGEIDLTQKFVAGYIESSLVYDIWDKKYNMFVEWNNTRKKMPVMRSKDALERSLSAWRNVQRQCKRHNVLKQSRLDKLNTIVEFWGKADNFNQNITDLIEFIKINKKMPSDKSLNKKIRSLGIWCTNMRQSKKNNKLEQSKIDQLNNVKGWFWAMPILFDINIIKLIEFVKQNSRLPFENAINLQEKQLAWWCRRQKYLKKLNKLDQMSIDRLQKEVVGWYWQRDTFNVNLEKLRIYVTQNNRFPCDNTKDKYETFLNQWCSDIRKYKRLNKLEQSQIDIMNAFPKWEWCLNKIDNLFNSHLTNVVEFVKTNDRIPSKNSKDIIEKKLGGWCNNKRQNFKKNILTQSQIINLEAIKHWYWDIGVPLVKHVFKEEVAIKIPVVAPKTKIIIPVTEQNIQVIIPVKKEKNPIEITSTEQNTQITIKNQKAKKPIIIPATEPKTVLVHTRPYQAALRKIALELYDNKCVITDRPFNLDVAHIKPDCMCNLQEKSNQHNMLLLNTCVHRFFDNFELTIDAETCKVNISKNITDKSLSQYHDKKIENLSPETIEYLKWHNKCYRKEHK
jgi:superfamily II DNA or RNA helicase